MTTMSGVTPGDIVIDDARVSWHHAVLRPEADHWTLEDENSTNGTYAEGRRVHEWDVGPGSVIRFGSPSDGPCAVLLGIPTPERPSAVSMPGLTGTFRQPTAVRPLPTRTVRIGRADDNDLVVDDLVVSRHHAELRALPDATYEIVDLGSHNGTYLNGRPVTSAPSGPATSSASGTRRSAWSATPSRSTSTPATSPSTSRTSRSPSTTAARPCSTTCPSRWARSACSRWSARAAPGSPRS